ncbi:unnamed protein product, partial [Pylaiella littoralis]
MGSRRGLHPTAGALLGLGTGCIVFALGDADSKARREISTRASAIRREVLLAALSKRLQGAGARAAGGGGGGGGGCTQALGHQFYVVTGPDAHLTSLATDRVSRAVCSNNSSDSSDRDSVVALTGAGSHSSSTRRGVEEEEGDAIVDNSARLCPPPARLSVPYGCKLGTGMFSSLVEQQLLRPQETTTLIVDHGGREREQPQRQQMQQPQLSYGSADWKPEQQDRWDHPKRGSDEDEPPPSPPSTETATRVMPPASVVSNWESIVLWATLAVLDGEELDKATLWALECALSGGPCCSDCAESLRKNDDNDDLEKSASSSELASPTQPNPATPNAYKRVSLVMEICRPESLQEDGQETGDDLTSGAPCGDLARWGWRLASRGLGSVVLSSSNPWVLAELQQALRHAASAEREESSEETSDEISWGNSDEVVVVRVALPSAAEREQAVLSVARELGVDHLLSAEDASMLAELTGGRRAGLLGVLKMLQRSLPGVTVAEVSEAAVSEQARALAAAWGLLSPGSISGDSNAKGDEAGTCGGGGHFDVSRRKESRTGAPTKLGVSTAVGVAEENSNTGDTAAGSGGGGGRGSVDRPNSREEWAPLWEVMGMLSVPSVTVGATAAGATSAPSPPPGSAHPAELSEECAVDGATLLRLTRGGWLELSPAAPAMSGTVLEDDASWRGDVSHPSPPPDARQRHPHHRPPVRIHSASVPLESLSRGVDRSFVGVPPFRLAAFRRLLDQHHFSWTTTTTTPRKYTEHHGMGGGIMQGTGSHKTYEYGGGGGGGGGGAAHVGGGDSDGAGAQLNKDSGGLEGRRGANGGGPEMGQSEIGIGEAGETELIRAAGDEGLERAGCLIEAAILRRLYDREGAKLSEDGSALSSNWAELGTARGALERDGQADDTSDGEWAELQLELIRQERAIVGRASEMRARRERAHDLRRKILQLEERAELLPSTPHQHQHQHQQQQQQAPQTSTSPQENFQETGHPTLTPREGKKVVLTGKEIGVGEGPDDMRGCTTGFAEDEVIRDVERGVRLVPLLTTRKRFGDSSVCTPAGGAEDGNNGDSGGSGGGDGGGGLQGRGYGVKRLWSWMRG